MSRDNNGFLVGAIIGAAVGAAAGILLAPKEGSKTRKELKDTLEVYKDKLEESYGDLLDRAKDLPSEAAIATKKVKDEAEERINRIRQSAEEIVADSSDEVEEVVSPVETEAPRVTKKRYFKGAK